MSPDDTYWAACERREFVLQRCPRCASWQFPPAAFCRNCLADNMAWEAPSGRGVVWSWIRFHKGYFKSLDLELPYRVALIELAEGPRMISTVVGPDERLKCGAEVEVVFQEGGAGRALPMFQLVN